MFYAFDWIYGINIVDEEGNPVGHARAFFRKRDRDAWVSEGRRRSVTSQREALRSMASELLSYLGCIAYEGVIYEKAWEIIQNVPAQAIVGMYEQIMDETRMS